MFNTVIRALFKLLAFYFTTACRCQVLCDSCKKFPRTSLQCCNIFFWSFRIIDASTIKCWEFSVPLKPVLGGVRDVACIHYPSCTDSIKPSLQFSCNFVVINASEGSFCFQIFILHNSRCQVLCGSCKKLPRNALQCCYIFLVLRDHWCQHY
jgi:hypothetical protein